MATFSPFGLQPIKYLNGAAWNGQTNPYLIAPQYANNIFRGDLVVIGTNGYILSLADYASAIKVGAGGTPMNTTPALGIFTGCSYTNVSGVNPTDPASPGRMMWASGTQTLGNEPAVAAIADDPNLVCLIQTDLAAGVTQANMFSDIAVAFSMNGTQVQGNFTNGTSTMYAASSTIAANPANHLNLLMLRISNIGNNAASVPYNIVEVTLNQHYFVTRTI